MRYLLFYSFRDTTAGSGKTIVLALKVAYLHAHHPDWTIAVTFNTRSLKGQFERLINLNSEVEVGFMQISWPILVSCLGLRIQLRRSWDTVS